MIQAEDNMDMCKVRITVEKQGRFIRLYGEVIEEDYTDRYCDISLSEEEVRKLVQELQKLLPQNEPAIGIDTVTGIVKYYECIPGTTKVVKKVNITSSAESSVQTLQELLEIAKEVKNNG